MAFSQVIEDKNSPTGKSLVRLSGATDAGSAAAMAVAQEAKQTADAALPKAGGKMTGNLLIEKTTPQINQTCVGADRTNEIGNGQGWFGMYDENNLPMSFFATAARATDTITYMRLYAPQAENATADLGIVYPRAGEPYAYGPGPRSLYNNDLATMMSVMNFAQQKTIANVNMYVGGDNASDTADLRDGRGLAPDKPFATPLAAALFAITHYSGAYSINLCLQSDDLVWDYTTGLYAPNLYSLKLTSDTTKRTLTLAKPINVTGDNIQITNLNLVTSGTIDCFMRASSLERIAHLYLAHLDFSGTVTQGTVVADSGATIYINTELTGEVTGPRFLCRRGSKILGFGTNRDGIPGSADGVLTADSIYA